MSYSNTQDNESKKNISYQFHGNKRMIEHNHTKSSGGYDEGYRSQEGTALRNVYTYGKQKGNITQNARDKQTTSKPKTFNHCQFKCTSEAI